MKTNSRYTHLECHECQKSYPKDEINNFCQDCHQPLVAQYDLTSDCTPDILRGRALNMWRYKEFLPLEKEENIVSLGEGMTPILPLYKLASLLGLDYLVLKDESGNPTGSFKARGLSMAVSKAKELGIYTFCIPTAGNAGSALSAYAAKMDGKAYVYMPKATPTVFQKDCVIMGAKVTKVEGSIKDAGAVMNLVKQKDWWDVTTLKEPFRLEGKKTMGYEIAEQLYWKLPDVIIYPTGGGTGLIGIWKAFKELKKLGWIKSIPSRMVAVQSSACDPVVDAFNKKMDHTETFTLPGITIANGLRVPKAFGDKLIMKTLYESNGTAISVSDTDMYDAMRECASTEGIFLSPEGAAVMHATKVLKKSGFIKKSDRVLALNTGSGYKYIENIC